MDQSAITRAVTVAGGRFAPGHLGELTQQVPFEMVDAVLEQTCRVQRRVRELPARVVVYLLLAGCLFAELGYGQVWHRLAAGLDGLAAAAPTASAMTQARRRLGPGPLRELFFLLRGPAPGGARWRGLLVVAIDGTVMAVAGQRGEPGRLLQAARRPERRLRLPDAAAAGPGQLRHPHRHRRRVQPCLQRRDHLRPGPARQPARGDGPARRPELRRRVPGRAGRGNQGGLPDPRPHREQRPEAPRPAPLPDGSWLSRFGGVPVRVIDAAGHRHHQRRARHRRLPAGHHPDRPGPLPRRRPGRPLPRALGNRDRLLRAQVHDPRRPGPARPHPRRHRAGGLRPAGHLPGAAHRHRRRRRAPSPAPTPTAPASPSP